MFFTILGGRKTKRRLKDRGEIGGGFIAKGFRDFVNRQIAIKHQVFRVLHLDFGKIIDDGAIHVPLKETRNMRMRIIHMGHHVIDVPAFVGGILDIL